MADVDIAVLVQKRDELHGLELALGHDLGTPDFELPSSQKAVYLIALASLPTAIVLLDDQGPDPARDITGEILRELNPSLLFNLGTAMGNPDRVSLASVVVSEHVYNLSETKLAPRGRVRFRPRHHEAPGKIRREFGNFINRISRDRLRNALRDKRTPASIIPNNVPEVFDWDKIVVSLEHMAGGAALVLDPRYVRQLWDHDDRYATYDMESGGFAEAARRRDGLMWLIIRGVSDYGTAETKVEALRNLAAYEAALVFRWFIEEGLYECHPRTLRIPESSARELSRGQFYTRFDSLAFVKQEVGTRLSVDIRDLDLERDVSLDDLAAICLAGGAEESRVLPTLQQIREDYFTEKYLPYVYDNDIRGLVPGWSKEFRDVVIGELSIDLDQTSILDVGVGNGLELEPLFGMEAMVLGADVSHEMLIAARERYPNLRTIHEPAENLSSVETGTIDLYVSLRTWVSRLFNIAQATREAFRVVRPGGHIVISVPNGYADEYRAGKGIVRGMLVPGSDRLVDRSEPRRLTNLIMHRLEAIGFENVSFSGRKTDIYIWARRPEVGMLAAETPKSSTIVEQPSVYLGLPGQRSLAVREDPSTDGWQHQVVAIRDRMTQGARQLRSSNLRVTKGR